MKKALKVIAVCIIVLGLWMLASVRWMKSINAEKWEKISAIHHCKPIQNGMYQCDFGKTKKIDFDQ